MLRLIGFLSVAAIGLSGFLVIDYSMARTAAADESEDALTVQNYLGDLSARIASFAASSPASNLPTKLADMLPRPPEGWTVRPAVAEDATTFQPRRGRDGDPVASALIETVVSGTTPSGAEAVTLTYEQGEQRVVIKAIRYPDHIFTTVAGLAQRALLQSSQAAFREIDLMTVRGLDVTEDWLPDGMRGRLLIADLGGQIHLRVLVPRRMSDANLLPFFETLHVKALNASVVEQQEGLGDVPVIVLGSALNEADSLAYVADRAARKTAMAVRRDEARKAADAEAAARAKDNGETAAAPAVPVRTEIRCEIGVGGIKRCTTGD